MAVNFGDYEVMKMYQKSPLPFIRDMWGLTPQPVKPEYEDELKALIFLGEFKKIKAEWFEPKTGAEVKKEKLLTWQQCQVMWAVERALNGRGSKRISIVSGHGTGKSASLAILCLWWLWSFYESQVPCTAPTSVQLKDILWKEITSWHSRMPTAAALNYEVQADYVRMVDSPQRWFARGKTASKDRPEALAGVHGEHLLYLIDEASAVHEEVYNVAEGSLTEDNYIFIMASNGTRTVGKFCDSHHKGAKDYQTIALSSEDSPLVEDGYVQKYLDKYGREHDEFIIRVAGGFPSMDSVTADGYGPLLPNQALRITTDDKMIGTLRMGVDIAGEGSNESVWTVRSAFKGKVVAKEKTSTPKSIAAMTSILMDKFKIPANEVYLDAFGDGGETIQELAKIGIYIKAINVSKKPEDSTDPFYRDIDNEKDLYLNLRAKGYWKLREWLAAGGELYQDDGWEQLFFIRYRRAGQGVIQIMPKKDMLKQGFDSPDIADSLMLTFVGDDIIQPEKRREIERQMFDEEENTSFNPFQPL